MLVCTSHDGTNEDGNSLFTLSSAEADDCHELECLIWHTPEEDAHFVCVVNVVGCVFFRPDSQSPNSLFHLITFRDPSIFFSTDTL